VTRQQATSAVLEAKASKGVTFEDIAKRVKRHVVWTTSALLGQASMNKDEARAACEYLSLEPDVEAALQSFPMKGSLESPVPTDPLLYRFHEINQVYGSTIKALIHEQFGDGIMSAIDFELDIKRICDPHGDRVQITFNGKFLPYRKW
jgi:cyanate lyase